MPFWHASDGSRGWWGTTPTTGETTWWPISSSSTTSSTVWLSPYSTTAWPTPTAYDQQAYQALRQAQQYANQLNSQGQLLGHYNTPLPPAFNHERAQQNQLIAQQNRYQPTAYNHERALEQLATPAILRRPRAIGEAQEAYEARREAQRAELEARRQASLSEYNEIRQRAEAVAQRRREAEQRAMALLREHLSREQLAMLDASGFFIVVGESGRRYRLNINRGFSGNIEVFHANDNRVIHRLCCHLDHSLPSADHFLAQKIMLEFAEADFLRLANRHAP